MTSISTKLTLKQGQQLVMTPQLQQSIRLLQYSNVELLQFIEGEIKSNPLLEMAEQDPLEDALVDKTTLNRQEDKNSDLSNIETISEYSALDFEKLPKQEDISFNNADDQSYGDSPSVLDNFSNSKPSTLSSSKTTRNNFDIEENNIENYKQEEISLKEHLFQQMFLALRDPQERLIASHLIDMVDEAGYFHGDLEEISLKLSAPPQKTSKVFQVLQTLEPSGVFARSVSECLALQLKDKNRFDPLMDLLLKNLPLVANKAIELLTKIVGVDSDEILDMIEEIKKLNPKPGLIFGSIPIQPIIPDILVRASSDGGWIVELNNDTLPHVLVNQSYYAKITKKKYSQQDKNYLQECLQSANWLVKSLDQRARTILKVAKEIVRQQDGFLTNGIQHLRPMNLKIIADSVSMHESTISRVTSNKYISTPRGVFELKYFFTTAIAPSNDQGESHSSKAVQFRIKQLIETEKETSVLSDDSIVEHLKNDGVEIARRTVAKYREAMRIPSSVERRRHKKFSERAAQQT